MLFLYLITCCAAIAQINIPLPYELRDEIKPQLSGLTWHNNRLFVLPQYLNNRGKKLEGELFIYSIAADSIAGVLNREDTALTTCTRVKIINAEKLPADVHEHYEGFEAIVMHGNKVYLTIECKKSGTDNFLLCGRLRKNETEVVLDPKSVIRLPKFDNKFNVGFESLAYNEKHNTLTAFYEFNANIPVNYAYEIDPKSKQIRKITVPFSYFRITDVTGSNDTLFALNYNWGGEFLTYLKDYQPNQIPDSVPETKELLNANASYLNDRTRTFTRIMYLDPSGHSQWKTAVVIGDAKNENNWEGLVRFKDGFLIISDSNENALLTTTLRYIPYYL